MLNLIIHNQSEEQKQAVEGIMKSKESVFNEAKAGEKCYADSQGWLDTEEWADDAKLKHLEEFAKEIRANADAFVLIGVGGSNNAARSVVEALREDGAPEIIYAGNTLSPDALNRMMKKLEGKSIYIDCIAKNFETLEPGSSFRILRQYMEKTYGEEAHKRIIATGTIGSSLEELCTKYGYTFLEFPLNVGGRYTAMTNVGLLPMAVAGIDIRALVQGAKDMQKRVHEESAENNIAYQYACLRNLYYQEGYRVEMLSSFEPQFRFFYKWWIQLFAESEGKENKGIFPAAVDFSTDLHSMGQWIQEGERTIYETVISVEKTNHKLEVPSDAQNLDGLNFLAGKRVDEVNKMAELGTQLAHVDGGVPNIRIVIPALNEESIGGLLYFFEKACGISGYLLGVNPFNQPGVEAYKKNMFALLNKPGYEEESKAIRARL